MCPLTSQEAGQSEQPPPAAAAEEEEDEEAMDESPDKPEPEPVKPVELDADAAGGGGATGSEEQDSPAGLTIQDSKERWARLHSNRALGSPRLLL